MRIAFLSILVFLAVHSAIAQHDAEFPKEFIMHIRLHNGMITNFHGSTVDAYVGGIQAVPQYTFIANKLRGGLIAGAYYTGKKLQGEIGPTVSLKLKTLDLKPITSGGNIHLNFDYLFGTERERLIGGGINFDLINKVIVGFTAHRDYNLNTWWFQNSVAIRINKVKKSTTIFHRNP